MKVINIEVVAKGLIYPIEVLLNRGSWGSPDPLRFSDSEACLTWFSGKVRVLLDTSNNFEQNLVQCFFCFRAVNLWEKILKDITFLGVTPTVG